MKEEEKFEFPKLYTEFAQYYDELEKNNRDYQREARWLASIFEEKRPKRILDLSCGTGSHISLLKSELKGTKAELYAMDASDQMIKLAKRKMKKSSEQSQMCSFARADFLSAPFQPGSFDALICMYWSIAGLNESLVSMLFAEAYSILSSGGTFTFDTENSEGIKENLLDAPFIDAYFKSEEGKGFNIFRVNRSVKTAKDLVDWRAYYVIESDDEPRSASVYLDRMNLRFYSRKQIESLLGQAGFSTREVLSGPFDEYREASPSLYFVAEKGI